jgi:hypothetical protein
VLLRCALGVAVQLLLLLLLLLQMFVKCPSPFLYFPPFTPSATARAADAITVITLQIILLSLLQGLVMLSPSFTLH